MVDVRNAAEGNGIVNKMVWVCETMVAQIVLKVCGDIFYIIGQKFFDSLNKKIEKMIDKMFDVDKQSNLATVNTNHNNDLNVNDNDLSRVAGDHINPNNNDVQV